jgi:hypothetical protein
MEEPMLNPRRLILGSQIKLLKAIRHSLNRKTLPKFSYKFFLRFLLSSKLKNLITNEINSLKYWHNEFYYKKGYEHSFNYSSVKKSAFWATVKEALDKPSIMLDLGAGVRPFTALSPDVHIIVELFEPYLSILKAKPYQKTLLVQEDVVKFCKSQISNSFDTIIVNDVIEHLSRADGDILIQELKRITSNQILIFTPNGFMEMHEQESTHGWQILGNSAQNHISGWEPGDFNSWEIIKCDEYHKEIGYDGGAFAAIYKKELHKQNLSNSSILVVISKELEDSLEIQLVNFLTKSLNEYKDFLSVTYVLHNSLSPYSHKINHKINYSEDFFQIYYTSGNPINNRFIKYKRELDLEWLDKQYSLLLYFFQDDYMESVNSSILATKRILLSNIEDFNQINFR